MPMFGPNAAMHRYMARLTARVGLQPGPAAYLAFLTRTEEDRSGTAVMQRRQPRRPNLDWADRALLATPARCDTEGATSSGAAGPPGLSAAGPAGQPQAGPSRPWCSGWLARTPAGLLQNPWRAVRPGSENSSVDGMEI